MTQAGPRGAAPGPPAYEARVGDARRDRDAVIALWRGNLGREDRLASKYDWFYLACPWGEPLVEVLHHAPSASPVGVAAAGPRRMIAGKTELRAGVLVDLAVSTQHRSLGPALTLQKALMAAGGERFDLMYGFPNAKAAPVFKRVGYVELGALVRFACVLRFGNHLGRVMPRAAARPLGWLLDGAISARQELAARRGPEARWRVQWTDRVDPRMDDLWSRSEHGSEPMAVRDTTMLRWRFDDAPLPKTRYLLLSDETDQLQAWFACEDDGATMHVRDYWAIDAARGLSPSTILALLRAARKAGHSVVSIEYAGPAHRRAAWLDAGFMPRSRRPIFGRWKNASSGGDDRADIHLTSADEDE